MMVGMVTATGCPGLGGALVTDGACWRNGRVRHTPSPCLPDDAIRYVLNLLTHSQLLGTWVLCA